MAKNKTKYDFAIFIGRMQPPTRAHIATINQALSIADKVIIFLGSSFQPRTIKNPWTHHERASMVLNELPADIGSRIIFKPIHDYRYNDQEWVQQIQQKVRQQTVSQENPKICIIGCNKDDTSYYLKYFPQWDSIDTDHIVDVDATTVREQYFENTLRLWSDYELISIKLKEYLQKWAKTADFLKLKREYEFIQTYKKGWETSPYPPTFVTADAIVIQSGHILLVQRKATPGEGLWAVPGGFVNTNEPIENAAIRELREETKLKVPEPVLRGNIIGNRVFDAPNRSLRGRTITHAYAFELPAGPLTKVKGGDDARKAKWIPISEALEMEEFMFEDHIELVRWGVSLCR